MTNQEFSRRLVIAEILNKNNISYFIDSEGKVFAQESGRQGNTHIEKIIEVTNFTGAEIMEWLGY